MSTTMTEDSASVQVRDRIDHKERLIFQRLLEVRSYFSLQTQLRVAGGWVRDKLLGRDCCDIDIAIDDMLGKEFCEKVKQYMLSIGEEAEIDVIPCNPDKSKHLETARMRLLDVEIDVVNLRSEDYSKNSRIPTMRLGTPEKDANRRDLTINSLFYHINTSTVEDFTGRGLVDLISGKIVTPLPPKKTFLDDPLRVLRAVRFGAMFGFTLDGELKNAASGDDVKYAIANKISRERVGDEIDKMVSCCQPAKSISYILDLSLFWVVFSLPPEVDPPSFQGCESLDRICIADMDAAWNLMRLIGCSAFNDEQRRLALYATLFLSLRSSTYKDNKSKELPLVSYIFCDSLKRKASDAETVVNVHNATKKLVSLIPLILSNPEVDWRRVTLDVPVASKVRILAGLLLREIKDFWRVSLLASVLVYPTNIDDAKDSSAEQLKLEKRSRTFKIVENAITDMGLEKVWEMKLVNGKDIMSILQLKAGGPLVGEWQQKLLEWQLANPSGSSEECLDWRRQASSKRARVE